MLEFIIMATQDSRFELFRSMAEYYRREMDLDQLDSD